MSAVDLATLNPDLAKLNPSYYVKNSDDLQKLQTVMRIAAVASLIYAIVALSYFPLFNFTPLCMAVLGFGISEAILGNVISALRKKALMILSLRPALPYVPFVGPLTLTRNLDTQDYTQPIVRHDSEGRKTYLNLGNEDPEERAVDTITLSLDPTKGIFRRPPKLAPFPPPYVCSGPPDGITKHVTMKWLGHNSWLIQFKPTVDAPIMQILVDPYFEDKIALKCGLALYNRCSPVGAQTTLDHDALMRTLTPDVVLITHNHSDHFDPLTITQMKRNNPNLVVLAPEGTGERLRQTYGIDTAYDHLWGQSTLLSNDHCQVACTFVPANHSSAGTDPATGSVLRPQSELWGGWHLNFSWGNFLSRGNYSMYFSGDTACHMFDQRTPDTAALIDHDATMFAEIKAKSGHLDAMVFPIEPPDDSEEVMHSNIIQTTQLLDQVFNGVPCIIPTHYGTWSWDHTYPENMLRPLDIFREHLRTHEALAKRVCIMKTGDQRTLC